MRMPRPRILENMTMFAPTRGIATILALSLMGWGAWVLNPFTETFSNPIYAVLMAVATEPAWGVIFIGVGIMLIVGVAKKSATTIKWAAGIGWLLWLLVSILYAIAVPSATMVWTNFCLALMHAWIYLQAQIHPELISGEITINDLQRYKEERNG